MRHGSLFSGIGGFDLAAEWMGWENVFHCEWNKFGQQVLKYYWPKAISYEDITKTDFTIHRGSIDILTGGFPCQPYSSAGKRLGKEDERHLWPEMLRAIREIQPSWVVGENVRGLTNWNGGMVFDEVQAELEAQGYEVLPFLLPACAVNAPHRRDRIWFVANTNSNGLNECNGNNEVNTSEGGEYALGNINESNGDVDVADSKCARLEQRYKTRDIRSTETKTSREWSELTNDSKANGNGERNITDTECIFIKDKWIESRILGEKNSGWKTRGFEYGNLQTNWLNFPTVSPICNGDDGLSNRLDNITFPKWRQESIKAGGNAIVPQVVHQIFKAIEEYERITTPNTN
jgi:DNA (cytosine-5)-methyltransferase 1